MSFQRSKCHWRHGQSDGRISLASKLVHRTYICIWLTFPQGQLALVRLPLPRSRGELTWLAASVGYSVGQIVSVEALPFDIKQGFNTVTDPGSGCYVC
jgi:hypothetical protein